MDLDQNEAPGALAGASEGGGIVQEIDFNTSALYFANAKDKHPTPPAFPILARHWPDFPMDFEGAG